MPQPQEESLTIERLRSLPDDKLRAELLKKENRETFLRQEGHPLQHTKIQDLYGLVTDVLRKNYYLAFGFDEDGLTPLESDEDTPASSKPKASPKKGKVAKPVAKKPKTLSKKSKAANGASMEAGDAGIIAIAESLVELDSKVDDLFSNLDDTNGVLSGALVAIQRVLGLHTKVLHTLYCMNVEPIESLDDLADDDKEDD